MRAILKAVAGAGADAIGVGIELSGITNVPVGLGFIAIGTPLLVWALFQAYREWRQRRIVGKGNDKPTNDRQKAKAELPSRRETKGHGLTEWEHDKLIATLDDMVYSGEHDHRLDVVSIIEDLENGRSLQGPCGICGKPRIRLGGIEPEGLKDGNSKAT